MRFLWFARFFFLLTGFSLHAQDTTKVYYDDGTSEVIKIIRLDDFPVPTRTLSYSGGALVHARFWYDKYISANQVLQFNAIVGSIGKSSTGAMTEFNYNRYLVSTALKVNTKLYTHTNREARNVYFVKVPAALRIKAGIRLSGALTYWDNNLPYSQNRDLKGIGTLLPGCGLVVSFTRYAHIIANNMESGTATETRLFFLPTFPVMFLLNEESEGRLPEKIKDFNDAYGFNSRIGFRAGIEWKIFRSFFYPRTLVGGNVYFMIENNHYYAHGVYLGSFYPADSNNYGIPVSVNPAKNISFIVGLGYTFMRRRPVQKTDDEERY